MKGKKDIVKDQTIPFSPFHSCCQNDSTNCHSESVNEWQNPFQIPSHAYIPKRKLQNKILSRTKVYCLTRSRSQLRYEYTLILFTPICVTGWLIVHLSAQNKIHYFGKLQMLDNFQSWTIESQNLLGYLLNKGSLFNLCTMHCLPSGCIFNKTPVSFQLPLIN